MGQNGDVYMSVEVLAIIIATASLLVTLGGGLFAGFAWMLRRMDERFAQADAYVNERFAQAEANVVERVVQSEANVGERFAQAEGHVSQRFTQTDVILNERFNKIDKNFDRVDTRFDRLNEELSRDANRADRGQDFHSATRGSDSATHPATVIIASRKVYCSRSKVWPTSNASSPKISFSSVPLTVMLTSSISAAVATVP